MKENQRIRLSKQLLRDSLIELLQEKSINKISVREICDRAEINRTTFYKYYGSQYDLLNDMENMVLTELEFYLKKRDHQALIDIITFISNNVDLWRILANNNVDLDFPNKILSHPLIEERISEIVTKETSESFLGYHHTFIINGYYSVLKCWLNKTNRETPEELCRHLQKLVDYYV